MSTSISFGTYNILDPIYAEKHHQQEGLGTEGAWANRKAKLLQNLKIANLDVVALQEVCDTSFTADELSKLGYSIIHAKHQMGHDGVAILYKKNLFKKKSDATHCVSSRRHLVVDLEHKTSEKTISVGTCHLLGGHRYNLSDPQVNDLKQMMEERSSNVKIILGDFNQTQADQSVKLLQDRYITDGSFDISEPAKNRRIDHIFVSGGQVVPTKISLRHPNASDHYLIASTVTFAASKTFVSTASTNIATHAFGASPQSISSMPQRPDAFSPESVQGKVWREFEKVRFKRDQENQRLSLGGFDEDEVLDILTRVMEQSLSLDPEKVKRDFKKELAVSMSLEETSSVIQDAVDDLDKAIKMAFPISEVKSIRSLKPEMGPTQSRKPVAALAKTSKVARFFKKIGSFFAAVGRWFINLFRKKR